LFSPEIYGRLVGFAMAGSLVDYATLYGSVGAARSSGPELQAICLEEHLHGRPLLTAIVVKKETRQPGAGFFEWVAAHDSGATTCACGSSLRNESDADSSFAAREQEAVRGFWRTHRLEPTSFGTYTVERSRE
jgi:hypothetical protein